MTGESHRAHNDLADRFFGAIEAGDVEAVLECYAANALIWHNTNGIDQLPAENAQSLLAFFARLRQRRYVGVRRILHGGGFVQHHVLTGTLASGAEFAWPACLVVSVENGLIVRIDEYLDSAPAAALAAP